MKNFDIATLDFSKGGGTVTVVAQDATTGAVLMVAQADREALEKTLETGEMHYRSRTRGLWHKGATSGNTQRVEELIADCDGDAILARVMPSGPACHTGSVSCFADSVPGALAALARTIDSRASGAADTTDRSYTRRLLGDRNLRLKKIGEEASEFVLACADGDAARATEEAADIVFHTLVALRSVGQSLSDVQRVIAGRRE